MFAKSEDDVLLDPAAAYPQFAALGAAVDRRDWAACRTVLDAGSLSGRTHLLRLASERRDIEQWLRQVLQGDPWDSTAAALLGMNLIDIGWEIRGGAGAEHVGADRFTGFHHWLRRAEEVLIDGAARWPYDPALWTVRLTTARGLQLDLAEIRRRHDRMAAADPHHLPGQSSYLQSLCPKWYGDWPQAHAWAREAMTAAPPGAPQGALVAEAHIEHWLDIAEDDESAATTYLAGVRDSLHEAAHRSIWHPAFVRDVGWVSVVSTFAMAFAEMGDRDAAGAAFAMLGPLASEWPFEYRGDNVAAVIRTYRRRSSAAPTGSRR
ncbi:hypothetical protein [Actinoplanes sp. CA-252034]|uniref:hypothetical protein n=1 Tax=Actinoplanes sp. CA-252034 TaxID=3239906 RepID=UPI003D960F6A